MHLTASESRCLSQLFGLLDPIPHALQARLGFDLPDELVRRIKIEAAQSDRKLKDLVAQLLEAGLRASRDDGSAAALPKPVKRRRGGPLTADAIEAAIAAGRQ